MSDDRPRPQYGEYATPEQQQAAIREPLPQPVVEPVHTAPTPPSAAPISPVAPAKVPGDRVVTLILLGIGLLSVLLIGLPMASFSVMLPEVLLQAGVPAEYANIERSRLWDVAMCAVYVIGFAVTAFFALRRLRAGKLSWWIPIVGAVITGVLFNIVASTAYATDPGFLAYMDILLGATTPTPVETP